MGIFSRGRSAAPGKVECGRCEGVTPDGERHPEITVPPHTPDGGLLPTPAGTPGAGASGTSAPVATTDGLLLRVQHPGAVDEDAEPPTILPGFIFLPSTRDSLSKSVCFCFPVSVCLTIIPRPASPGFGSRVRAAAGTAVRSYGGRRPSSLLWRLRLQAQGKPCGPKRLPWKYLQLKKKLEDEFPSRLDICGEGTPQVTGFFEVFVAGKLVHSKKGGDGYVDTESKFLKLVAAIKAALAQA
ncbi:hypothetical protein R6Z07F_013487 [Ovis aries]